MLGPPPVMGSPKIRKIRGQSRKAAGTKPSGPGSDQAAAAVGTNICCFFSCTKSILPIGGGETGERASR